jgi:hypothetical protein
MAEHFVSEGATVLIDSRILEPGCQPWFVQDYDLVVVNTIVPFRFIDDMKNYNIPVLWWIHDALEGYGYLDPVLMENVADNVHVYCGGEYAKWVLQKYRPKIQAEVLLYGFDDYSKDKIEERER